MRGDEKRPEVEADDSVHPVPRLWVLLLHAAFENRLERYGPYRTKIDADGERTHCRNTISDDRARAVMIIYRKMEVIVVSYVCTKGGNEFKHNGRTFRPFKLTEHNPYQNLCQLDQCKGTQAAYEGEQKFLLTWNLKSITSNQ